MIKVNIYTTLDDHCAHVITSAWTLLYNKFNWSTKRKHALPQLSHPTYAEHEKMDQATDFMPSGISTNLITLSEKPVKGHKYSVLLKQ